VAFKFDGKYEPKAKEGAWVPRSAFDKCLWQLLEAGKFTKDEIAALTMQEGERIGKAWWSPAMVERYLGDAVSDMKAAGLSPAVKQ